MSDFNIVVDSCRYLLNNCPDAEDHLNYLNSRIDKDCQEKFKFGYFPGSSKIGLLTSLVGEDLLKKLGLIHDKEYHDSIHAGKILVSYFENHPLIMPYKDVYGNVVGLVGRSLLNDRDRKELKIPSKYKNTSFSKGNHLFGLYEAKESILERDLVYVVEGQFDVIKAFERGITNIVAVGSSNMTFQQVSLLCRYTNNILLLLDNDEAGESGRRKIYNKFSNYVNIISKFHLPMGYKDIDEYLKDNSFESLSFLLY